jgi:hypothetical protein
MVAVLLLAQMAVVAPPHQSDSVYATAALKSAVAAAALANRDAPSALAAYRAHLESEIGLLIVDTLGRERIGQVEQIASRAMWSRDSGYNAHILGYRTQSAGVPMSMLGFIKAYSLPMLYGERLLLGFEGTDESLGGVRGRGSRRDTIIAVHPFAADRDRYYMFSGGDTVAVLTVGQRKIPLVRIRVKPNMGSESGFAAFDGEIDIDANRYDIVRMRGEFVINKLPSPSLTARLILKGTGTVGVAYAEFVNAEYDERYWLPATQRIELQAQVAMLGGMRSVIRVVSKFSDFDIDDTAATVGPTPPAAYTRRRITFAPSDSMSAYSGWLDPMGTATSSVSANDFSDIAPPAWKGAGPPRYTLYPSQPGRVVHYDRVEGLFTGAELSLSMRDAAPGVTARAHGGWAWTEQTARGGIAMSKATNTSTSALLADRSLVSTADFRTDLDEGGSSIGAFFGSVEDVDYVDRWSARVINTRVLGSVQRGLISGQLGFARDVDAPANLTHGPIRRSVLFLPNRHAATGNYAFGVIDYELHPNVTGVFLGSGVGASIHVESAAGQLSWTRTEATLSARSNVGPVTIASRMSGGAVFSADLPPQTLFEIGGNSFLSGYRYKEFAGDRAAIFSAIGLYSFPIFRAPHRINRFLIPGLSPGFGGGIEGGWTQISNDAASRAVLALGDGTTANAVSRATGPVRSDASVGLTFFGHAFHVGVARPLDHPAPWRWIAGFGQGF